MHKRTPRPMPARMLAGLSTVQVTGLAVLGDVLPWPQFDVMFANPAWLASLARS